MSTYRITFDITTPTDPNKWDWDLFLNCDDDENYHVKIIEKVNA